MTSSDLAPILQDPAIREFRAGLAPDDRDIFDDLLRRAAQHHLAVKYSGHDLPLHVWLVSLLIEEHKLIRLLRDRIEQLKRSGHSTGL